MKDWIFKIVLCLGMVTLTVGEDLMDQIFGEALLNSLNPELKDKLEFLFNHDKLKDKPISKLSKIVRSKLNPEEIKEIEKQYKKLLLPMLQTTLANKFGSTRKIENINELPIDFEDLEESEETEIEDLTSEEVANYRTASEELSEGENKGQNKKAGNDEKMDSPRPIGDGDDQNKSEDKSSKQKETKRSDGFKAKTEPSRSKKLRTEDADKEKGNDQKKKLDKNPVPKTKKEKTKGAAKDEL